MANTSRSDIEFLQQFEPDVFWEKHGRKVIAIAVAALAVGAAVFLWQRHGIQEEENAALRLASARDAATLQGIIQDYPGKNVAADAMMRLGDVYYREGKYDEAAAVYQKFLAEYPRHPLVQSGRFGLAAVQEAKGNFHAARDQYLQLATADRGGYLFLAAGMGAARCAESLGQTKEARQMYEELFAAAQGSLWQSECARRWRVLSRDLPPEPVQPAPTQPAPSQLPVAPVPSPAGN